MPRLATVAAGALLAGPLCCQAAGPQQYTIQDLGYAGLMFPEALNSNNQVTGHGGAWLSFDVPEHAFLWTAGSMLDLGTLADGQTSYGEGINDAGQVVGMSLTTSSNGSGHAFVYSNGSMTDLGTLGGTTLLAGAVLRGGASRRAPRGRA